MTHSIHPTLALIDSNIQELQQLILEFEALAFPTEEPTPVAPCCQPIRLKMRAGKGYDDLAKQINRRMQDHPDWQNLSGTQLRQRMGGQMLYRDHVYVFEAVNLLSRDPISGGLDPAQLKRAQEAGAKWRDGGRERWLAEQRMDEPCVQHPHSSTQPSSASDVPPRLTPSATDESSAQESGQTLLATESESEETANHLSPDCTTAFQGTLDTPPQKIMTSPQLDVWMAMTGTFTAQRSADCTTGTVSNTGYTIDLGPIQDQLQSNWSIKRMRSGEIALQHAIAGEWISTKLELVGLQSIKFTLSSLVGEWQIGDRQIQAQMGGFVVIRRKNTQQNNPDRTPATQWSVDQVLEWTRKGWHRFQEVLEELPAPEPVATPTRSIPDFGIDFTQEQSWWDEHEEKIKGIGLLVGAGALVTGTLVEDVVTGGAGIADDPASFAAAAAMASAGISAF